MYRCDTVSEPSKSMPMSKSHGTHSSGPELRKFLAPEVIFGVGALHLAGQHGRKLGGSAAIPMLEHKAENLHPLAKRNFK